MIILSVPKKRIGTLTNSGSLVSRTFLSISKLKVTQAKVFVIKTKISVKVIANSVNMRKLINAYMITDEINIL